MASTRTLCSKTNVQQRNPFPAESRPRLLKDFLNDNLDPCPSTGFKSFPRKPCNPKAQRFIEKDPTAGHLNTKSTAILLRSRSKAASATVSAFHAMINVVKKFHFTTLKPTSVLPRSLSRKNPSMARETKITVTVKDIVRWASFRDLLEEKSAAMDFASSPSHCTTTTASTATTTTTCSSNGSSWCESDFTSEDLPPWTGPSQECSENEAEPGKKYSPCVGGDYMEPTTGAESYAAAGPEVETTEWNEEEQKSPVSVFHFQVGENKDPFSSFARCLASVESTRQNLLQRIQRFENLANPEPFDTEKWKSMEENTRFVEEEEEEDELEKKARELLNHVKATSSVDIGKAHVEKLLLDFFGDELSIKRPQTKDDDEFNCKMVSKAEAWISGEYKGLYEWKVEHKRDAYVKEMDRRAKWSTFEEEQEEIALEIETELLGCLVDEVLIDLF